MQNINITFVVQLVLLLASFILMGYGVWTDIKERRYPNSILLSTIIVGLVYAVVSHQIVEAIVGFLIVNLIGIFLHKFSLMSPGDMKYLSSLFLFISLTDIRSCMMLLAYMVVITLVLGYYFYKKLEKNMGEELKKEMKAYKMLFMFRVNTFSSLKYENKEEMLEKTMPFTLPIYLSFILTFATNLIIYALF